MTILYALATILGWGSWAAVARDVRSANSQAKLLYATLANLAVAAAVFALTGGSLPPGSFWAPFAGGVVWSISGLFAFAAIERIGLARAVGIWVCINIFVGLAWGALLFGELAGLSATSLALTGLALLILVAGVLLMSGRSPGADRKGARRGVLGAAVAGVLWGSYFIPVSASGIPVWSASLPLAAGMAFGALLLALFFGGKAAPLLARPADYLRAGLSGALWALGNYGMLLLGEAIGTGRGFAIAQLNLGLSACIGIFVFKEQAPGSPAARRVLLGALIAMLGGVLFGLAR